MQPQQQPMFMQLLIAPGVHLGWRLSPKMERVLILGMKSEWWGIAQI